MIFFLRLYFFICDGLILLSVNIFSGWGVLIIFSNVELDNISEIAHILRLPGTANHKYEHKPLCEIVEINDNTYRLDDFLEKIPDSFDKSLVDTSKKPLRELYKGSKEGSRNSDLTRLVGSWVSDGLTFDECLENAHIVNVRNNSPLEESEIIRTINSIIKKEKSKSVTLLNNDIHNTDLGNSERIINSFGGVIRYCGTWKKWLVWNDQYGVWQIDDSGEASKIS